jgi:hypothetical protein
MSMKAGSDRTYITSSGFSTMNNNTFRAYQRLVLPVWHALAIARGHPHFDDKESLRLAQKIAMIDGVAPEDALQQIKEFQTMPILGD